MKNKKYQDIENYILEEFNNENGLIKNNFEIIRNRIDITYSKNECRRSFRFKYSYLLSVFVLLISLVVGLNLFGKSDSVKKEDPLYKDNRYLIKELNYDPVIKDSKSYYLEIVFNYSIYTENLNIDLEEYYYINNMNYLNKMNLNVSLDFEISPFSQAIYLYLDDKEFDYYFNNIGLEEKLKEINKESYVYDIILYDIDNNETKMYLKKYNYINDSMVELSGRLFDINNEVNLSIQFNYPDYEKGGLSIETSKESIEEYYLNQNKIYLDKINIDGLNVTMSGTSSTVNINFDSYFEYLDIKNELIGKSNEEYINIIIVNLINENIKYDDINTNFNSKIKQIKKDMTIKEVVSILGIYSDYSFENGKVKFIYKDKDVIKCEIICVYKESNLYITDIVLGG